MKSFVKNVILSQVEYLNFELYLRKIRNQILKNYYCFQLTFNDYYS